MMQYRQTRDVPDPVPVVPTPTSHTRSNNLLRGHQAPQVVPVSRTTTTATTTNRTPSYRPSTEVTRIIIIIISFLIDLFFTLNNNFLGICTISRNTTK